MTAQGLAKRMEKPVRWVYRNKEQLAFLELRHPVGFERYSPELVEEWLASRPIPTYGAGKLKLRRVS